MLHEIRKVNDREITLTAFQFTKKQPASNIAGNEPDRRFDSSVIGIHRVSHLSSTREEFGLHDIEYKYVIHKVNDAIYAYPLIAVE